MVRSDKLAPHPLVSQEELLPFSAEHTNRIQAERQVQGNAMPRIAVKNADSLRKHPREFSLLYELGGSAEGIDSQALVDGAKVYGDVDAVQKLVAGDSGAVDAEQLAQAFQKPSQLSSAEGAPDANTLSWAARDSGAVLSPYKFSRRQLGPKDVFIKITHTGMCHSDLHTINGDWGPAKYPVVPGHEIVGIVTEVGSEVTKFKPGDRAGVGTYVGSCRSCAMCKEGEDIFCPKMVMTYNSEDEHGMVTQGGYSTHTVVDEHYCHTIPTNLDLAGVAPLLCAGITTYAPYKDHGFDTPGKKVGVVGLGGLGHMAVKFGVAFGCEVYVISRNKNKEDMAKQLGAKAIIPSGDEEEMKKAAGTLDAIIDTVSAQHDINAVMALLRPRGRYVMLGVPPKQPTINHTGVIFKCLVLTGSLVGNLAMTQEMLNFCGEKNITSDVEVIDMDYVNEAMKRMEKGDVHFRFVIDINKSLHL